MKGAHRFSPSTGAELSRDRHQPGTIPLRESLDEDGELSNGRLVSQTDLALSRYFRRMAHRHDVDDVALHRAAALAIRRLRSEDPWDCWLWYALAERLHRRGFDTEWMLAHADPRCPRCGGRLQWKPRLTDHPLARCAIGCSRNPNRTPEIMDAIVDLYNQAFVDDQSSGEPISSLEFI